MTPLFDSFVNKIVLEYNENPLDIMRRTNMIRNDILNPLMDNINKLTSLLRNPVIQTSPYRSPFLRSLYYVKDSDNTRNLYINPHNRQLRDIVINDLYNVLRNLDHIIKIPNIDNEVLRIRYAMLDQIDKIKNIRP